MKTKAKIGSALKTLESLHGLLLCGECCCVESAAACACMPIYMLYYIKGLVNTAVRMLSVAFQQKKGMSHSCIIVK